MAAPNIELTSLLKNISESLVLSVLSEGEKHGYQIGLDIENRSGGTFKFSPGTLYPILHKLEKEEYIKGIWESEGTKRKRKFYALNEKGKEYFIGRQAGLYAFIDSLFNVIGEPVS